MQKVTTFGAIRGGDVVRTELGGPTLRVLTSKVMLMPLGVNLLMSLTDEAATWCYAPADHPIILVYRPYQQDKQWYHVLGELWTVIRKVESFLAQTAGRVDPEYQGQLEEQLRLLRESQDTYELGKLQESERT